MTFYLGDIDNITQVKLYVNITNDITSGKMQSAQHNSMQIQVYIHCRETKSWEAFQNLIQLFWRNGNFSCLLPVRENFHGPLRRSLSISRNKSLLQNFFCFLADELEAISARWIRDIAECQAQSFLLTPGRLALGSALRTDLQVWAGTLNEVTGAQAKTLGSNGAHTAQFIQKLTVYSSQKSVYRAMAMGDVIVIDLLVHDMTHTQHSPSGLVLCMRRIMH